jgi:hypothetical protein
MFFEKGYFYSTTRDTIAKVKWWKAARNYPNSFCPDHPDLAITPFSLI